MSTTSGPTVPLKTGNSMGCAPSLNDIVAVRCLSIGPLAFQPIKALSLTASSSAEISDAVQ
jgi:hypothetical protein